MNVFKGGTTYVIPGPEDRFGLKVGPPFGQEKVIVYASEVPTGDIPLQKMDGGLGSYAGSLDSLSRDVRGIWPVPIGTSQPNAEFYEAMWVLETKAQ
jgi:hypothetical protein